MSVKYNSAEQHPVYWFEDGSVVIHVENQIFKVHRTLLSRHSDFFVEEDGTEDISGKEAASYILIDECLGVRAKDVEVLLAHFYHDVPLHWETRVSRLTSALRVSGPSELDFPSMHYLARTRLNDVAIVPSNYLSGFLSDDEDALYLSTECDSPSVRKASYYHFMTSPTSQFNIEPTIPDPKDATVDLSTSQLVSQRCEQLLDRMIEYFTPVLFTPPATAHMACTDVFADTWMSLVIQPAIDDHGVSRPLETLERIKGINWASEGLCESCVDEKREEWTQEQQHIWNSMDTWLEIPQ
ncbi:hypothetical protein H0H93_011864 [Arthromyces matolae]|nr:hypothetical protein H0H93_011864 [Arthromyces matolae]